MKIKELKLTIGISRSGKSTFAKKLLEESDSDLIYPDGVRFKILNSFVSKVYFDPKKEKQIQSIVFDKYDESLNKNNNVVFDATNLTWKKRYPIITRARKFGYKIIFYVFEISLLECLKRDKQFENKGERFVGEHILAEQFHLFKFPSDWEYDECKIIKLKNNKQVIEDK